MTPAEARVVLEYLLTHIGTAYFIAGVILTGAGAVIVAAAIAYTRWRKGAGQVEQAVDTETETLIKLLKDQNALLEGQNEMLLGVIDDLSSKITNLEAQVGRMNDWFALLACGAAPTCIHRDCPARKDIDAMLDGFTDRSDAVKHSVQINEAAGKLNEQKARELGYEGTD